MYSGDLFTSDAPALAHGVNTRGIMGGVAAGFRIRWPSMYDEYRERCAAGELHPGDLMAWHGEDRWILNLVTQSSPGPSARLSWLRGSLEAALRFADREEIERIAMPRIGCGFGGLRYEEVEPVLSELAAGSACDIDLWSL